MSKVSDSIMHTRHGVSMDIMYSIYLGRSLVKQHLDWDELMKWRTHYQKQCPDTKMEIVVENETYEDARKWLKRS